MNRFRQHHLYAALLTIIGLYLLSYFDFGGARYWWAYSIGIAMGAGASYLIGNTKVRIETNGEAVTVEHSGMVHANFTVDSVASVTVSGSGSMSRIVVVTHEGLKYYIPCECFSKTETEALLKVLRRA
ncbi:MAG: hypothetical protein KDJ54_18775 [Candidatus Competibacteraceae bacterium]|nr:hypothetical protein [Candidatus Competibacteraceae bacterium]